MAGMKRGEFKVTEILSPAGDLERLKWAFRYGADAVYIGTPKLSLRSRSEASDSDIAKTIEYAHKKRQTCACSN